MHGPIYMVNAKRAKDVEQIRTSPDAIVLDAFIESAVDHLHEWLADALHIALQLRC